MLHVATIHFKNPRWIPIQARQLRQHIGVPYRTWGSLQGIDASHCGDFDRAIEQQGSHGEKLNHLAIEISSEAADDDLLMFLDGDAFPVADPMPLIERGLSEAPLMAVGRDSAPQPHPCFCVTKVATWRELPGDWGKGFVWHGPRGEAVSDVGANLLRRLELSGTPWMRIDRSNATDRHPVLFGIYGDAIYHHGAGFRAPCTLADLEHLESYGLTPEGQSAEVDAIVARNRRLSEEIFAQIRDDEPGWVEQFAGPVRP